MIINVNGLIQYSKLSWGHFRKCRGNITKYFFLAKIYIIKQDIRLHIWCVQLDRLGWIFSWTIMGGRGVFSKYFFPRATPSPSVSVIQIWVKLKRIKKKHLAKSYINKIVYCCYNFLKSPIYSFSQD